MKLMVWLSYFQVEDVQQEEEGEATNDDGNKEDEEEAPQHSGATTDEDKAMEVDSETPEVVDEEEKADDSQKDENDEVPVECIDGEKDAEQTKSDEGDGTNKEQECEEERLDSKEDDSERKEEGEIDEEQKDDGQVEEPVSVVMEITSETPQEAEGVKEVEEEDCVPGTSQYVAEPEVTISDESTSQKADSVEEPTLEEAKEKIVVLEKRLVREETLRKTAEKHSASLVEQVNQCSVLSICGYTFSFTYNMITITFC